jgi:hypothetical protein
MIGVFGTWNDVLLPRRFADAWVLLLVVVVAIAIVVGRTRERATVLATAAVLVVLLLFFNPNGWELQGRHVLVPFVVLVFCAVHITLRHVDVPSRVMAVVGAMVVAGQAFALFVNVSSPYDDDTGWVSRDFQPDWESLRGPFVVVLAGAWLVWTLAHATREDRSENGDPEPLPLGESRTPVASTP